MRKEGDSNSIQGGLKRSGDLFQYIYLSIYSILHSVDVRDNWNGSGSQKSVLMLVSIFTISQWAAQQCCLHHNQQKYKKKKCI